MEVLAISVMIGALGLLMREVMVTREETKRVRLLAAHEARFDAEMKRTNKSFVKLMKKELKK